MTLTLMFLLTKKMRYTMEQAVRMKIREEREIMVIVFFSYCLETMFRSMYHCISTLHSALRQTEKLCSSHLYIKTLLLWITLTTQRTKLLGRDQSNEKEEVDFHETYPFIASAM